MISFATQVVTRRRAPLVDDGHGNDVPDWGSAEDVDLNWWSVQPGVTDENLQGRDATLIQWTAFGPADADVLSTDRIVYSGQVLEIDGEPARWPSPTGAVAHTVLLLKAWNG